MARSHRIGQTRRVKVFRLVTRNTYEAEMLSRANKKLGLERAMNADRAGDGIGAADGKRLAGPPQVRGGWGWEGMYGRREGVPEQRMGKRMECEGNGGRESTAVL
jgi:hypothetical protein